MNITGTAQNDILTGTDEDDLVRGLAGADRLLGRGGNDDLLGGPGDDVLDGNRGADRMRGEDGNDQYYVNDVGDTVLESTAGRIGGVDRVFTSVSFVLGDHLEHLTMYGTAVLGRGNDLANIIRGNSVDNVLQGLRGDDVIFGGLGNDRLDGGLGADTLIGGRGDDAYYADSRLDVVIEDADGGIDTLFTSDSRRLDANIENLTMYGRARNAVGNELDNVMVGNSTANVMLGEAGNDTISGGKGDDNLRGGDGDDVINGGVTETAIVDTSVESISEEQLLAFYEDGADFIDGGDGTDTLIYTDLFEYDSEYFNFGIYTGYSVDLENGTVTSENSLISEGVVIPLSQDVIISIENVTLGSGDDTVFGSDFANIITLNNGRSDVWAGAGDDIINGGYCFFNGFDDEKPSEFIAEVLRGGDGNDVINSGGSAYCYGYINADDTTRTKDILFGGSGDDKLVGGAGYITMAGEDGADTFEFFDNTWVDGFEGAFVVSGDVSHITDFDPTEGDNLVIHREDQDIAPETQFVGEVADVMAGELGYERVVRGDTTHTIVRHGFRPSEDFGFDADEINTDLLYTTIILDNYAGPISESDFLIV